MEYISPDFNLINLENGINDILSPSPDNELPGRPIIPTTPTVPQG